MKIDNIKNRKKIVDMFFKGNTPEDNLALVDEIIYHAKKEIIDQACFEIRVGNLYISCPNKLENVQEAIHLLELKQRHLSTDKSGTELPFKVPSPDGSDKPCPYNCRNGEIHIQNDNQDDYEECPHCRQGSSLN